MRTEIIGTGSCLPETAVSNDELAQIIDTSDEWIRTRTGIRERHLAKEETTVSMCVEAARNALADAKIEAEEIDLIIVGTVTGDFVTPSTACLVQAQLGAKKALAFDINGACSGFLFAFHIASAYINTGMCKTALLLGAETLSRIVDWSDRSTCVLFGDGAGAAVVRGITDMNFGEENASVIRSSLPVFDMGCDGEKGMVLSCRNRMNRNPLVSNPAELDFVHMDGQAVYKFAVSTVPKSIERALAQAGMTAKEVDWFVLHQANARILQAVAKRLGQPEEKFPMSLDHCGNISAASIPILLDEMNRKGMLKRGQKLVLSGFGGGLTWGTAVLLW